MKHYFNILLCASAVFVSCNNNNNEGKQTVREAVSVKTVEVSEQGECGVKSYSATVVEDASTAVSFATAGTVKTLNVRDGQHVAKGALVATIDDRSLQSAYASAQAMLVQAEDAHRRLKQLHDKGSVPEIQWVEVESKLRQARSTEEIARKALSDTKLYAPCSGVVTEKNVEVGQNIAPGMPIFNIINASVMRVKAAVPEADINSIKIGSKATVTINALDGKAIEGKVTEKSMEANPLTRTYGVYVTVNNQGELLRPGMIGSVSLTDENRTAQSVNLPVRSVLLAENNQHFVWVVLQGKAQRRDVEIGEYTAQGVSVTSGLKPGDKVIVEGMQKVCNGTKVK